MCRTAIARSSRPPHLDNVTGFMTHTMRRWGPTVPHSCEGRPYVPRGIRLLHPRPGLQTAAPGNTVRPIDRSGIPRGPIQLPFCLTVVQPRPASRQQSARIRCHPQQRVGDTSRRRGTGYGRDGIEVQPIGWSSAGVVSPPCVSVPKVAEAASSMWINEMAPPCRGADSSRHGARSNKPESTVRSRRRSLSAARSRPCRRRAIPAPHWI